jgi:hypothetical protein
MQRSHFKQPDILEVRLADEAKRLRKEAQGTPPGAYPSDLSQWCGEREKESFSARLRSHFQSAWS